VAGFKLKVDAGGLGELRDAQIALMRRLVLRVERNAKTLCPVDTGRLRSSITSNVRLIGTRSEGGLRAPITGTVGSDVKYASYVELGTRKMAARPFLRPALAAAEGDVAARGTVDAKRQEHRAAAAAASAELKRQRTARKVKRNVAKSQAIRRRAGRGRFLP